MAKVIISFGFISILLSSCFTFSTKRDDTNIIEKDSIYNESYKLAKEIIDNPVRIYDLKYYYPSFINENYLSSEMKVVSYLTMQYLFTKDSLRTYFVIKRVIVSKVDKLGFKYCYHLSQQVNLDNCYSIQFYYGKLILEFCFIKEDKHIYLCNIYKAIEVDM